VLRTHVAGQTAEVLTHISSVRRILTTRPVVFDIKLIEQITRGKCYLLYLFLLHVPERQMWQELSTAWFESQEGYSAKKQDKKACWLWNRLGV
jgi:hypothetical protein